MWVSTKPQKNEVRKTIAKLPNQKKEPVSFNFKGYKQTKTRLEDLIS